MLLRLVNIYRTSPFLKDSSFLFIFNTLVSSVNFILQYIVLRFFNNNNEFSLWVSLSGLITVVSTLVAGVSIEIVKNSSQLASEDETLPYVYFNFLITKIRQFCQYTLIISPLLAWILEFVINSGSVLLVWLTLVNLILGVYLTQNRNLLLGLLDIFNYNLSNFLITVLRLIFTIGLLIFSTGIFALPLGALISTFLGYILVEFMLNHKKLKLEKKIDYQNTKNFSLNKILKEFTQTGIVLFGGALFLQLSAISAGRLLLDKTDKDVFTLLVFFGQIIYFGSISFLSGLVAHATRSKNHKIYLFSIFGVSSIAIIFGSVIWLLGNFILAVLGQAEFSEAIPLIIMYSVFVGLYNIIYVSLQYLVAKNLSLIGMWVFVFLGIFILLLSIFSLGYLDFYSLFNLTNTSLNQNVFNLVTTNILVAAVGAMFFVIKIIKSKEF